MIINFLPSIKLTTLTALITLFNLSLGSSIAEAKALKSNQTLNSNLRLAPSLAQQKQQIDSPINRFNQQMPALIASSFQGTASWYGPKFHGRRTANGERFNQNAMTAAHPSLKFGTKVKVTNLNNGRSVVVTINDRGPFTGGRVIDVSAAAARSLNMIQSGVAPVQVTIMSR